MCLKIKNAPVVETCFVAMAEVSVVTSVMNDVKKSLGKWVSREPFEHRKVFVWS